MVGFQFLNDNLIKYESSFSSSSQNEEFPLGHAQRREIPVAGHPETMESPARGSIFYLLKF